MLFSLSHLVSSIFLILARDLLLVKARAARAVARMMISAPTITLEPALTTELREAAAACFSRSLEAEGRAQLANNSEENKAKLTDIGPVKIFEFTSLPHETIRTPEIEKEILFDWFIKYVFG